MRRLFSTPKEDGFWMPAEFEPHEGCFMIWPERSDSWQYGAYRARKAFIEVAEEIARSEQVTMLVSAAQYSTARTMLPEQIRVVEVSTDDAWMRDVGPTFVKNGKGELRGINWTFNAWGGLVDGLYFPWDKDNLVAPKVCDLERVDVYETGGFVLEGGSIHVDGEGTALVTESCLLSAGRNPSMKKEEIEEKLKDYLNVSKVIWLPRGIWNDETNEHVDNICAFAAPAHVLLAWTEDQEDPQYPLSLSCLKTLQQEKDAKGRSITVTKLPIPRKPVVMTREECEGLDLLYGEPTRTPGERLAASYVNFYIANHAVLMPAFGDENDEEAHRILVECFPDRKVIPIKARDILIGGGNIHCITQQMPKR